MRERLAIWCAWRLPRRVVYWAVIRAAVAPREGNPAERTAAEILTAWRKV